MLDPAQLAPRVLAALTRPGSAPLALEGRSGSGKTTLLRSLARSAAPQTVWYSAFDLTQELVGAIREGSYDVCRARIAEDPRPICIEHLEDLRGKPATRDEVRRLLLSAAAHRPVVVTLTRARGDAEVLEWLRPWAEVHSVD